MRLALSPNYPAVYWGTLGNAYRTCGANRGSDCRFKACHARSRHIRTSPSAWPHTQFIRRDTARVEADVAALRAAGLPMG